MIRPTSELSGSSSYLFRTPGLGYDFDSNSGRAFNYFSYGVACSEVEIDCLTGAHKVCRGSTMEVTSGRLGWVQNPIYVAESEFHHRDGCGSQHQPGDRHRTGESVWKEVLMSWWMWRLHQALSLSAGGGGVHAGSGSLHPRRASLLSSGRPPHSWSWFVQDSSLWRHSHQSDGVAAARRPQ